MLSFINNRQREKERHFIRTHNVFFYFPYFSNQIPEPLFFCFTQSTLIQRRKLSRVQHFVKKLFE